MKKLKFDKMDVDYTGSSVDNTVYQEILDLVKKNVSYRLAHDIWFAESAIFYTNLDDITASRLVKDIDYRVIDQDQIACDQSGQICVRQVQFSADYQRVFVDYHVYGDFVQAQDFQIIENWIDSITTDDIPEGKDHLYYTDTRVAQSPFSMKTQTTLKEQGIRLDQHQNSLSSLTTTLHNHIQTPAGDDILGHISLKNGQIDPLLIPNFGNLITMLIGSYLYFFSENVHENCVPLLGGILDPEDFSDELKLLKNRVPAFWIQNNGKIQLPNALYHTLNMDPTKPWGFLPENILTKSSFHAALAIPTQEENISTSLTLNSMIVLVTSQPKSILSYKTYELINPETRERYGLSIHLPITKESREGIGYNPDIMTEQTPATTNISPCFNLCEKGQKKSF